MIQDCKPDSRGQVLCLSAGVNLTDQKGNGCGPVVGHIFKGVPKLGFERQRSFVSGQGERTFQHETATLGFFAEGIETNNFFARFFRIIVRLLVAFLFRLLLVDVVFVFRFVVYHVVGFFADHRSTDG